MPTPSVITIGNFDGVHLGHAALVRRARDLASGRGARVVAVTFDPHPLTVLRPGAAPARLTTFERKAALLRAAGADEVERLAPDQRTLGLTPSEFLRSLAERQAPIALVEGPTFRFGHGRAGDTGTLAALGKVLGFSVEVLDPVEVALTDGTLAPATSSLARWLLEQGRVRDAAAVLGRPYGIDGTVERGDQRGRTIGFPTANIASECLVPGDGVYAGVGLVNRERLAAAISVGTKPTFGEHRRAVEAYFLDPLPAGLPEYGWAITLEFHGWVRDQVRFGDAAALVEQMNRDCERVRGTVAAPEAAPCP